MLTPTLKPKLTLTPVPASAPTVPSQTHSISQSVIHIHERIMLNTAESAEPLHVQERTPRPAPQGTATGTPAC